MVVATANRTSTNTIRDTIRESFVESFDGFWYPIEPGTPLVRVQLAPGSYQVQRRRRVTSAWTPVVTANAAEFDPAAFRIWRSSWPAVQV